MFIELVCGIKKIIGYLKFTVCPELALEDPNVIDPTRKDSPVVKTRWAPLVRKLPHSTLLPPSLCQGEKEELV
jgi:hypothetical protein